MSKIQRMFGALRRAPAALTGVSVPFRMAAPREDDFQFDGFEQHRIDSGFVEHLSDADLRELNTLLRWNCFTVDTRGRRFGRRAWAGKREAPQPIPDPRITLLNDRFPLADLDVLEVGCFEGVHTIALARLARKVVAVDARMENVVKTIVRCAMFGQHPTVYKCDLEDTSDVGRLPQVDVLHHIGVLYHLVDPVTHILGMGRYVRRAIMLDTHFAQAASATKTYDVGGRTFEYRQVKEGGKTEVFSGMSSHAKWLPLDTVRALLAETGFPRVEIVEERAERNGARVLLFAER